MKLPLFVSLSSLLLSLSLSAAIYRQDSRLAYSDLRDSLWIERGRSVGMMLRKSKLTWNDEEQVYDFTAKTLQKKYKLCPWVKFAEEPTLGFCTFSLVTPDTVLTAAHCVDSLKDCKKTAFTFDFVQGTKNFKEEQLYYCSQVVERKYEEYLLSTKDYALIKLDRPVLDRAPLPILQQKKFDPYMALAMIGHPNGLPKTYADWGYIVSSKNDFFRLDIFRVQLDAFSGNSGSPVFNAKTGDLAGVLTQGQVDWRWSKDDENRKCRDYAYHKKGETVFKIQAINL